VAKLGQKAQFVAALEASGPSKFEEGPPVGAQGDALRLALEYLECAETYPSAPQSTLIFHIRRICKEQLKQYQLMEECLAAASIEGLRRIVEQCLRYRNDPSLFQWDSEKEAREKQALEDKKREEGKRETFEQRMKRKAKREGYPEDHYLKKGLTPPCATDIKEVCCLPTEGRIQWWRERFSQHCLAFHTDGCARGRACAFLHVAIGAEDPSWLQEKG